MEVETFPRQCQICKAECLSVCLCTSAPCLYPVLQEAVYILSAVPLYTHTEFFFSCKFPAPELNSSPVKLLRSRDDEQLNSAAERKNDFH